MAKKTSKHYYNMAMTESRVLQFTPHKALVSVQFEDKDLQRGREREDDRMRRAKRYKRPYSKKALARARYFSSLLGQIKSKKSDLWDIFG